MRLGDFEMKRACSKCKAEKRESEFTVRKSRKSGFYSWCKACIAESVRNRRKGDPEASREYQRQRYKENPGKEKERFRVYYENN